MPKRSRKASPTDPNSDGFAVVEQATAEEAEILRDLGDAPQDPAAPAKDVTPEETQGKR